MNQNNFGRNHSTEQCSYLAKESESDTTARKFLLESNEHAREDYYDAIAVLKTDLKKHSLSFEEQQAVKYATASLKKGLTPTKYSSSLDKQLARSSEQVVNNWHTSLSEHNCLLGVREALSALGVDKTSSAFYANWQGRRWAKYADKKFENDPRFIEVPANCHQPGTIHVLQSKGYGHIFIDGQKPNQIFSDREQKLPLSNHAKYWGEEAFRLLYTNG